MTEQTGERHCAWCEAVAGPADTTCPKCGAALAQREDLGGLEIPGVTSVHPELQAAADRPLRIPGPSTSQGAASGLVVAAAAPGAAGLVIAGGILAVAANEFRGVGPGGLGADHARASVGQPSEAALRMVEQLDAAAASAPGGPGGGVDDSAGNSDNSTRD